MIAGVVRRSNPPPVGDAMFHDTTKTGGLLWKNASRRFPSDLLAPSSDHIVSGGKNPNLSNGKTLVDPR